MARQSEVTTDIMAKVDADYNLTNTVDPECKQRWFPLGIYTGYSDVMEPAHTFVCSQGRLKYLTPIYKALKDTNQLALAKQWLNENMNFYHPMAITSLQNLLGTSEEEGELFMQ